MATYAVDTYVPKFVNGFSQLQMFERDTGEAFSEPFDLDEELRIEIEDGDYVIAYEDMSPSNCRCFSPDVFDCGPAGTPDPMRFVNNAFIGSADLRDQKYTDYQYHLDECPITIQYDDNGAPKVKVRTKCDNGNCDAFDPECCTKVTETI